MSDILEFRRNVGRRMGSGWLFVECWSRGEKRSVGEKRGREGSSEIGGGELRGELELTAKHSLSRGDVGIFSWSCTKTEEYPGKMVEPVGVGGTCT